MPHDPKLVAATGAWLYAALRDLDAARFELTARPPFTADIVFHAQQAAQKAMKVFLAWTSTLFRKTHHLEELGEKCLCRDETLRSAIDAAVPLSQYAWRFRYPGEPDEPPPEEAAQALAIAWELYRSILARLPEEVRP